MAVPQVMNALHGKQSELTGIASHLEQQIVQHRASLVHLDAAMRLFDPDLAPEETSAPEYKPNLAGGSSYIRPGILHHGVAAAVAEVADLAMQPAAGQVGVGCHALTQVSLKRTDLGRAGLPRSVGPQLQAALDVFAHSLAVEPGAPRNGRHAQALSMQIQDLDEFPKPNRHRSLMAGSWVKPFVEISCW